MLLPIIPFLEIYNFKLFLSGPRTNGLCWLSICRYFYCTGSCIYPLVVSHTGIGWAERVEERGTYCLTKTARSLSRDNEKKRVIDFPENGFFHFQVCAAGVGVNFVNGIYSCPVRQWR